MGLLSTRRNPIRRHIGVDLAIRCNLPEYRLRLCLRRRRGARHAREELKNFSDERLLSILCASANEARDNRASHPGLIKQSRVMLSKLDAHGIDGPRISEI
jgi:hypothetical protein